MGKYIASLVMLLSLEQSADPNQGLGHSAGIQQLNYLCSKWLSYFFWCLNYVRSVPKMFQQQDDILARSTVETWVIKAEKGDIDCCPKCDGKVFEAEKMVTASVSKNFQTRLRF